MTHEDFLLLLTIDDENIIASSRVNSDSIIRFDTLAVISIESEKQFHDWLEANPLLKALR